MRLTVERWQEDIQSCRDAAAAAGATSSFNHTAAAGCSVPYVVASVYLLLVLPSCRVGGRPVVSMPSWSQLSDAAPTTSYSLYVRYTHGLAYFHSTRAIYVPYRRSRCTDVQHSKHRSVAR